MDCTPIVWSPSSADDLGPVVVVCSIAVVLHVIFWIQVLVFSSLKQRNMMWLYAYLMTDFFLLTRFFILYNLRLQAVCIYPTLRTVLCYFEASSKFYTNGVQTYLLLALNVCRYLQIVSNRDVFVEKFRLLIFILFVIIILPAVNVMVQFLANWTFLWRRTGSSCDIDYESLSVQIFNLFVIYIIPIVLNVIIIIFCIHHVSSTKGIRNQQIIDRRRKYQRTLLFQTITFYSIWLILWSPNVLAFQFINVNSTPGIYTSLVNYIELTVDPIIVAALDVRFFKLWQTIWRKIRGHRQATVAPIMPMVAVHK